MVFSSILFIFTFLPAVLLLYYLAPARFKNIVLLIFSLFFYAWGEPVYVLLMIYSIVFNYVMGIDIHRKSDKPAKARFSLLTAVVVNLFLLGFFKYYGFLADNLNLVLPVNLPKLSLALPIGLSFYTFQTLCYLVDVYRKKVPVQKNILSFGLYVSMFPQLVAGPIVQYSDVAQQLKNRTHSLAKFGQGAQYFIWGLTKKVLLANNLGSVFQTVQALPQMSTLSAWVGVLCYTFQIYFDFSGYSDMAIGLGKMFGFDFKPNFDHPYCAGSVTDFWRRWHISLGAWFREYIYIPLGGNRGGAARHIRNILIVWMLTGLWHGASWNFVLWGLYYGIFLVIEKYVLKSVLEKLPHLLRVLYTMLIVMIGWVFFFCSDLGSAATYLGTLFHMNGGPLFDNAGIYYLYTGLILLAAAALACTPFFYNIWMRAANTVKKRQIFLYSALHTVLFFLSVAYLINDTYNPFLYFRF